MGPILGLDFPHAVVSARRRDGLKREIEAAHREGQLCDLVFHSYERIFGCPLPGSCSGAESLIVGAVPQPHTRLGFCWRGRRFTASIPPSYVRYWETTQQKEDLLNGVLAPRGHWARFARLPQKALAVHSGLARYGRNNLTYVPGLGSLHMLVSYYSSLPCEGESWGAPVLLDRCADCTACVQSCPTGAISGDRFALRQDRCLTFYSGYSGPQEIPGWVDPSWIECLIGCLRCQHYCPENKPYRRWVEDEEGFSEEETAQLLAGLTPQDLPEAIRSKLAALGLIAFFGLAECLQMLSRKLAILIPRLEQPGSEAQGPSAR